MYLGMGSRIFASQIVPARRLVRLKPLLAFRSHRRRVPMVAVSWHGPMLAALRARRQFELLRVAAPKPRKIVLVERASVGIRRRIWIACRSGGSRILRHDGLSQESCRDR